MYFQLWEEDLSILLGSNLKNETQKKSVGVATGSMLVFSVPTVLLNHFKFHYTVYGITKDGWYNIVLIKQLS